MEWLYNGFVVDDDKARTDPHAVHELLKDTYWAKGRDLATIKKTIANSHCFNVWKDGRQVGFARVVTDYAVFGWIGDVIIDEAFRKLGLGKFLVQCICEHPEIPDRVLVLRTKDAHSLYERYGFERNEFMSR
jgi:predicted GNAT family N-acyltransferase